MQAEFEVKYINVSWYDQETVVSIQESFVPLSVEFDAKLQCFVCHTVIYPKAVGIQHGQLAFRYLESNPSTPYLMSAAGETVPLKKVVDTGSGKEWWIEANFWISNKKCWESKTHRTAGKLVAHLHGQICEVEIGLSDCTGPQLERYLSDFKSDFWELILDESSYISGSAKQTQKGGVTEESIRIIGKMLSHAESILASPKSELREVQIIGPAKKVRPVNRTFMELAAMGNSRYLTSRASKPSYNVAENRYVLFALETTYRILRQLVTISESKTRRFKAALGKLHDRDRGFGKEKKISRDLVRKDLAKLKLSYDLGSLNDALARRAGPLLISESPDDLLVKWYLKIGGRTKKGDGFFLGIKSDESENWFETEHTFQNVFFDLSGSRYGTLFEKDFEYEIEAELDRADGISNQGVPWYNYSIRKLRQIKVVGGINLQYRREKFLIQRRHAMALNDSGWVKKLTSLELAEQKRERISVQNQLHFYEEQREKAKRVYNSLEPKLKKFKHVLSELAGMGVKPSSNFPNSMTFVQNPNYQAVHSGYKSLRDLANLDDEDILMSLEEIENIGLINMPILYERWCLLQIIKVLIQNFHYRPSENWKRELLKIVSADKRNSCLDFENSYVKRSIRLRYEPVLANGRTPDFVMDVNIEKKDGEKATRRFVMDAKFYSLGVLRNSGGISGVIKSLYHDKDYSENGENSVFVVHPVPNAVSERVSPQSWGENSFLGELTMFDWDSDLRGGRYHKYGAICANPVVSGDYLDEFRRLIGMFLQFGVEDNDLHGGSDDTEAVNFCLACGSHALTRISKANGNSRSQWYECNECRHFTTYNHCHRCDTRLIKNGDYWTYHSQMPMEPLNIKCPACESLV